MTRIRIETPDHLIILGVPSPRDRLYLEVFARRPTTDRGATLLSADYGSVEELESDLVPYCRLPEALRSALGKHGRRPSAPGGASHGERHATFAGASYHVVLAATPVGVTPGADELGLWLLPTVESATVLRPSLHGHGTVLGANEVLVANTGSFAGMLEALVRAGVVLPTRRLVDANSLFAPVCLVTRAGSSPRSPRRTTAVPERPRPVIEDGLAALVAAFDAAPTPPVAEPKPEPAPSVWQRAAGLFLRRAP